MTTKLTPAEEAHAEYIEELEKLLSLQRDARSLQVAVGAVQAATAELRKMPGFKVNLSRGETLVYSLQDDHSTTAEAVRVQEQITRAARAAWAEFGELAE